jgi:hypothetical protein
MNDLSDPRISRKQSSDGKTTTLLTSETVDASQYAGDATQIPRAIR